MPHSTTRTELRRLLEKLCEERLEPADVVRLEELVLADGAARRFYVDYVSLHGSLHWDAAVNNASDSALTLPRLFAVGKCDSQNVPASAPTAENDAEPRELDVAARSIDTGPTPVSHRHTRRDRRRSWTNSRVATIASIAAALLVASLVGLLTFGNPFGTAGVDRNDVARVPVPVDRPDDRSPTDTPRPRHRPVRIGEAPVRDGGSPRPDELFQPERDTTVVAIPEGGSSDEVIVAFVNARLEAGWAGAEITPSPRADDSEWVRRVHLDLAGHIPPAELVESFLADEDPVKRAKLVDRLLDDPAYARHFATEWTNLLVGRRPSADVDREALLAYLREAFHHNRPWSDVTREIVAAEGSTDDNGSTNFLVAHVNAQAVPATAITARLFLGVQVQCTQCHDHPFNDWKQDQFWELNAFFKQTETVERDGKVRLENEDVGGPTFYETRQGLMMAAYPRYEGRGVDPDATPNRRLALVDLMLEGDRPQVADAIVNRTWAHFLGAGFTTPVDDMGPHNPPTHPALLARLSAEFVKSGYDLERLIGWITASEAYQRSSRFAAGSAAEGNAIDAPELGEAPLFSRVYVKPMTPEQVYDSLVMATWGDDADWQRTTRDRDDWVRRYVTPNGTDENDETLALDGGIPQALAVMNGELTDESTSLRPGTRLERIFASREKSTRKIQLAFLTALSREPTAEELDRLKRLFRDRRGATPAENLQDLYWALLNSNEFVQVH